MKRASPVPVCQADTLAERVFLAEFVAGSRPCVIRGAVRHWPAWGKWCDRDYLKSRCGHRGVVFYPHENFVVEKRMEAGKRMMNFAQALDLLHAAETEVASLGFPEELKELLPDIGAFPFLTRGEAPILYDPHVRHFLYRNAGTTWHYHPFDETLMCQVVGPKKIGLVSASTRFQKALHSVFFQEDYYDDPSILARFEGADLHWFSAELEEGDALYIPPLWWHGVIPLDAAFGVTTAVVWRSPPHVVAETIRKMDAGDIDLIGFASLPEVRRLVAAAAGLGMELDIRRSAPLSISIRPA
jgi:hypothetical protein